LKIPFSPVRLKYLNSFSSNVKSTSLKIKNLGRVDYDNKWNKIKEYWLNNYKNKDEITGHSVKKVITYKKNATGWNNRNT
jgi:hypothetical protein